MRFAVMVEGQEDVTWDDWRDLAATCERLGFETLLRSDHYLSVDDRRERGSLDAWGTICALAATTTTLRLGTLVSPATFRHPSVLAKLAVTADHVSGGRIELGVGTGWWEAEHEAYGFDFPSMKVRMDRMAEQLEVIAGSFREGPFTFAGEHYAVRDLDARPRPVQDPLPIVMGGAAKPRGAGLAARFAAEYNAVGATPQECLEVRGRLDQACQDAGRIPATLPLSVMCGFLVGRDVQDLAERADRLGAWRGQPVDIADLGRRWLVGTPDRLVERIREYAGMGVERIVLQHHLHRDHAALELLAERVVPELA
ncbi:MAG: LLM class flavin-dependent oxidoreductase [Solirubrobacterales bacterium]|nr:LLM class flavin-dependent oxidoreductase [Solirubrobacterales bacterium]